MSLRANCSASSFFAGIVLPMSNLTGEFPTGAVVSTSGWPQLLPMTQDTIFDGDEDLGLEKSENQGNKKQERSLPPLASNGDINLWLDEDKNGDVFLRVDAPFLGSEPVFFNDVAKPVLNKFVEQWREQRDGGGE